MVNLLRGIYRRAGDDKRHESLNQLWSLVPKGEDPEPVRGDCNPKTCEVRSPYCDEELVIELRCK